MYSFFLSLFLSFFFLVPRKSTDPRTEKPPKQERGSDDQTGSDEYKKKKRQKRQKRRKKTQPFLKSSQTLISISSSHSEALDPNPTHHLYSPFHIFSILYRLFTSSSSFRLPLILNLYHTPKYDIFLFDLFFGLSFRYMLLYNHPSSVQQSSSKTMECRKNRTFIH